MINKKINLITLIIFYIFFYISILLISATIYYYDSQIEKIQFDITSNKKQNYFPIFSQHNQLISNNNSYSSYIKYRDIPNVVINAFLSAEDKNYFHHSGIDLLAIMKSIFEFVFNHTEKLRGASTITQQFVKNVVIKSSNRALSRKIKEAIISFRITNKIGKKKLLELYLNSVFLGFNTYGVSQASQYYFGKSIKNLTISEAAQIASIPKAPSTYTTNKRKLLARRNWVISRMQKNGFITKYEKNISINDRIHKKKYIKKPIKYNYGYVTDYIKTKIPKNKEGIKIFSTIDIEIQKKVVKALNYAIHLTSSNYKIFQRNTNFQKFRSKILNNGFFTVYIDEINIAEKKISLIKSNFKNNKYIYINVKNIGNLKVGDVIAINKNNKGKYFIQSNTNLNGSIIISDIKTGRILGLSGGIDYNKSKFNRATAAKRQPGSLFKIIISTAALETGMSPNSILLDAPIQMQIGKKSWKPRNYSGLYYGPITLKKSVEKSRNLSTIYLAHKVGMKKIYEYAKMFKVLGGKDKIFPSMSLGTYEVSLIDIVYAYISIINSGKDIKPKIISYIKDIDENIIKTNTNFKCSSCKKNIFQIMPDESIFQVQNSLSNRIDPRTSYQIIDIMRGVVQKGTSKSLSNLSGYIGAKTGTSNDAKDTWMIAFTPKYIIGVFIGYDIPKNIAKNASGGKICTPAIKDLLQVLDRSGRFNIPYGLSSIFIRNKLYSGYFYIKDENIKKNQKEENSYYY